MSSSDADRSGLLAGQVAVITGAASGIGRATALAFASHGAAAVIVADVRSEPREGGRTSVDLLQDAGAVAQFVETDVSRPANLTRAVAVAESLGGLTTMVNCAGIFRREDFFEVTEESYEQMFAVNVRGTFFGCQAAATAMRERGGSIVNLASVASYRGERGTPRRGRYLDAPGRRPRAAGARRLDRLSVGTAGVGSRRRQRRRLPRVRSGGVRLGCVAHRRRGDGGVRLIELRQGRERSTSARGRRAVPRDPSPGQPRTACNRRTVCPRTVARR